MAIKKISIEKINSILEKCYHWIVGLILLLLFLVSLFIYYQNIYLVVHKEIEVNIDKSAINQETLSQVLSNIKERQDRLVEIKENHYRNPFNE
jgi:uncharacterized metal-binding protein